MIKRRDGSSFILQPISSSDSPLNIKGVNSKITASEIVNILKEIRQKESE